MNTMTYKNFATRVEYSEEDGCFVGHIAGIRDVIGFHGETVTELRAAFKEAVDDYLATCKNSGMHPTSHIPANSDCVWLRSCTPALQWWRKHAVKV